MSRGRAATAWLASHRANWQSAARDVERWRRQARLSLAEALSAVQYYQVLARELSVARSLAPGSRATKALEQLYADLHALLARNPSGGWRGVLALLREEIPAIVRALSDRILAMVVLMAFSAGAGYWLVDSHPTLISLVASDAMISHVESGTLWTEGLLNVTPSSLLSVRILSNNIAVSFMAVCAGCLFGLGTFYLIALNGLMLGAMFAFVGQHGLAMRLATFIAAHGPVELSVICIAGAMGTMIGESLIRPTLPTRLESFHACVRFIAPLLALCSVLLIGSGLIEGFISPDPRFPLWSRVAIGSSYWLLMVFIMTGWLPRRGLRR